MLKILPLIFLIAGCMHLPVAQKTNKPEEKVAIPISRINFAYRVCKENGKIKEIQVKPSELIICGNGAVFYK